MTGIGYVEGTERKQRTGSDKRVSMMICENIRKIEEAVHGEHNVSQTGVGPKASKREKARLTQAPDIASGSEGLHKSINIV